MKLAANWNKISEVEVQKCIKLKMKLKLEEQPCKQDCTGPLQAQLGLA